MVVLILLQNNLHQEFKMHNVIFAFKKYKTKNIIKIQSEKF